MRALIALAMVSGAGCTSLLGITDPTPATGDAGADAIADSSIDAPPACTAPTAFAAEQTFDTGEPALGFTVGDFDFGGVDDVVIATGDDLIILLGDGAGAFAVGAGVPRVPTAATNVTLEDFDSDGDDDLVMWTAGGSTVVLRRQNRAIDPPFEAEQPLVGPFTGVQHVLPANLDGALRPDLLVQDATGSRPYISLIGTPGTFAREDTLVGTGADELLLIQQIDRAQRADAVFVNAGAVKLALQTSSFGALQTIGTGATGRGAAFGNFDGDVFVDLVVATTTGLVLYRQDAGTPGTFVMAGPISPLTATSLQVADVNNDGRDDLILPTGFLLQCAPPAAGAPGVFTQFEAADLAPPLVVRDVTGDAKVDVLRLDGTALKVRVQ